MRNFKTLALAAVIPVVVLGGVAGARVKKSRDPSRTCLVTVDRSQAAGTYSVTRQELPNGNCICYLYTGPVAAQSTTLESRISALQAAQTCGDASAIGVAGGPYGAAGAASSAAGAATGAAGAAGAGAVAGTAMGVGGVGLAVAVPGALAALSLVVVANNGGGNKKPDSNGG